MTAMPVFLGVSASWVSGFFSSFLPPRVVLVLTVSLLGVWLGSLGAPNLWRSDGYPTVSGHHLRAGGARESSVLARLVHLCLAQAGHAEQVLGDGLALLDALPDQLAQGGWLHPDLVVGGQTVLLAELLDELPGQVVLTLAQGDLQLVLDDALLAVLAQPVQAALVPLALPDRQRGVDAGLDLALEAAGGHRLLQAQPVHEGGQQHLLKIPDLLLGELELGGSLRHLSLGLAHLEDQGVEFLELALPPHLL